jgi:hypothetical protein
LVLDYLIASLDIRLCDLIDLDSTVVAAIALFLEKRENLDTPSKSAKLEFYSNAVILASSET